MFAVPAGFLEPQLEPPGKKWRTIPERHRRDVHDHLVEEAGEASPGFLAPGAPLRGLDLLAAIDGLPELKARRSIADARCRRSF